MVTLTLKALIAGTTLATGAAAGAGGLLLTSAPAGATSNASVSRVAGTTRIGTAVAVSKARFPASGSAKAVVLARDDAFPDALAGAPLAAHVDGPLLLTEPSGLDPATQAEIERVLPRGAVVYLLGGSSAISPGTASALQALGYTTRRLAGTTRFATAVAIAGAIGNPAIVFEATGLDFADALGAGAAAGAGGGAVLLTDGSSQAPETAAYLAAHPSDTRYAIGGPAAHADPGATAVVGQDRFATAVDVAGRFFSSPSSVGVASGLAYPDALAAGPALAARKAPLLLVSPSTPLPSTVSSYLSAHQSTVSAATVYGGTTAVSAGVASAVQVAAGGPPFIPPAESTCSASMSNPTPPQGSTDDVLVTSRAPGAPVTAVAHFQTGATSHTATADSGGHADIPFAIGSAAAGHQVVVDVSISNAGRVVEACQTSFTPQ
ncbi:MAG: cell wall-binding repeat-containing protein [Acidimicrobiales bacterium]